MPSCTSPSSQPTAGTPCCAERELAGGGALQPHLVLEVGDEHAVALARLAGGRVEVQLGHQEQRQALGAGLRPDAGALGPGQHHVHDVLGQVVLGRGDEPLHALRCQLPVRLAHRLGAAGADVGPRVRLGEHHRGAPAALDHELGPAPLLRGAPFVDHGGEAGPGQVQERRRVGPEHQLGRGPLHASAARRSRRARPAARAATTRRPTAPGRPSRSDSGSATERVAGSNTGGWRSASANDAGERAGGHPVQLAQQVPRGVDIDARRTGRCPACPARGRPRTG